MEDRSGLLRAVDAAFAVTGADTPPWPDPHEGREVRDEEYSRCLDPAKYRILAARGDAWAKVLCERGLADPEPVPDAAACASLWHRPPEVDVSSAVLLRPRRPDAVPLVLAHAAIDDVPRSLLVLGAGDPAVPLETVPDCGCDACDDGSAGILEIVDEHVLAVVEGTFVYVDDGRGGRLLATEDDGLSARDWDSGAHPVDKTLAEARAGRSPHYVLTGPAWA
ncbi:DUF6226 family protein [Streptomyces sp. NPDC052225]|uniref:DUF6226 family protein n=1 Tax=Streptomyces sp. NPDC052225 TaxID=3154949 RepID=UPI0034441990